jgi:hypothetical protein
MKHIRYYLIASVAVGLFQIIDGLTLSFLGKGILNNAFALIEFIWVLVSIWAVIKFIKVKLLFIVPLTYVIYNVFGWCYGAFLVIKTKNLNEVNVPLWFAIFGACFGVYFALMNYRLYRINKK